MIIRSISGIRGTAPEFNSEYVFRCAQAFHIQQPKGVFMLGRDTRLSGEFFIEDIAQALVSSGRDVINLNIVPTPTVQFMVENTDAVGGIIVTASHNPSEWNGLKFVSEDGTFLLPDECEKLFSIVDSDERYNEHDNIKKIVKIIHPEVRSKMNNFINMLMIW